MSSLKEVQEVSEFFLLVKCSSNFPNIFLINAYQILVSKLFHWDLGMLQRLTPQVPYLHAVQQTAVMISTAITSYLHEHLINS